jgi:hypothetical protein
MNPALVVATGGKVFAIHRLRFSVPKDRYLKLAYIKLLETRISHKVTKIGYTYCRQ